MNAAGARFELTTTGSFEAAHAIAAGPDGHAYRGVHGHSFHVEISVAGTLGADAAWVEDFAVIRAALAVTTGKLDHQMLNDVPGLACPTLEHLCVWIAADLSARLPGLTRVTVSRPSLNERCALSLAAIA
jgi:6-pyruvoyltetrahydropterin/6-carboxytetrahydropterin synthase